MKGSGVRTRLHRAIAAGAIGALLSACNGSGSSATGSAVQAAALGAPRARFVESVPMSRSEASGFIVRSWGSPLVDAPAASRESHASGSPSDSASILGAPGASSGGIVKASGSVTLAWQPPTENTNGTALTNLAGFNIHYGTQSENYTSTIQIANPGVTRYVVEDLPAGTYYFAVTAYTTAGEDSAYSPQVSATVD